MLCAVVTDFLHPSDSPQLFILVTVGQQLYSLDPPIALTVLLNRLTLHSFTVTAIGWGEAQELLPPSPPPRRASNVSVGVGGVSSRWAQLLSFHQNTTGTGEGHREFRIARFH